MTSPGPKRWGGLFRIVEITYGSGELRYEIEKRKMSQEGSIWVSIGESFYTLRSAEDAATKLFHLTEISRKVIT